MSVPFFLIRHAYIYIHICKTVIVIISKSKNSHEQNVLRIQFYICCTNFIRIGEQIRDVIETSRDAVTSL